MQRVWSTYLDGRTGVTMAVPHLMDNSSVRRNSVASHANSTISQSASTRHLTMASNPLEPPNAPFIQPSGSSSSSINRGKDDSSVSLTVNYLPSKFSSTMLSPGPRRRKAKTMSTGIPKRGGGLDAFRSGESRMPEQNDEDYDGVSSGWFGRDGSRPGKKLRWNRFKWLLFLANTLLTIYSICALIFCLLTWFDVWTHADIVRVANSEELIFSTIASCLGIITSLVGWAGILLNNRAFLAVFTFMCWITFAFLVVPGYLTYKQKTFNLEGKINSQWSRTLGVDGRLRVQNQLECCGYFSPFVEATVSQTCYSRSVLPGCKLDYLNFQRMVLRKWYTVSFALVPVHIFVTVTGLLCSNHVTYRFGKGMMPKAYRLSMGSMAVIMDNYASQLAEQYGSDVASDILTKSRSNLAVDTLGSNMMSMPYAGNSPGTPYSHAKYDSVGNSIQ